MNSNSIKTFLLLLLMTIFFLIIGELIGGQVGMTYAFIFAIAANFFSYWFSDKIVLSMYQAMPILPEKEPKLARKTEFKTSNDQALLQPHKYLHQKFII